MEGMTGKRTRERLASISVRDLVSFVWREGGLARSFERRLPNRALKGTRGHQEIQRNRPSGYVPEVSVRYEYSLGSDLLRVFGRIDGVFPDQSPVIVEEIKTVTRLWNGKADPLHWAQLRFYAAVYADKHDQSDIVTQLTYLNLDTRQIEVFSRPEKRADLDLYLHETLSRYATWLQRYWDWCEVRDRSIATLPFPFDLRRRGQAELMAGVDEALKFKKRFFVEAATGLGKTMAILYPVVRSFSEGTTDRVFYLSAKNTGKEAALKALGVLREKGLRLRSLNLRSKTNTCVRDGHPCDMETCPLARDYYRNQKLAMEDALVHDDLDYERLMAIGSRHQVCPFELALDVAPFVDLILCDYNYVFDQQQLLGRSLRTISGSAVGLVDESHNLVERGREMYSAELRTSDVGDLISEIGKDSRGLSRSLGEFLKLFEVGEEGIGKVDDYPEQQLLLGGLPSEVSGNSGGDLRLRDGFVSIGVPEWVMDVLHRLLSEMDQWLATGLSTSFGESLLEFYFELLHFVRLTEHDPERFRCFVEGSRKPTLRLYCVDPASMLRESMNAFGTTVCFSGTLSPLPLFRRLLGGEEYDPILRLGSPFDAERLKIVLSTQIDTRLRFRCFSETALVDQIIGTVGKNVGGYLVFFSSYRYLIDVVSALRQRCIDRGRLVTGEVPLKEERSTGWARKRQSKKSKPFQRFIIERGFPGGQLESEIGCDVECVWQTPGLNDMERKRLIDNISCSPTETVITFAVLGGLFGEAVDVPGNRLKGVIVVGVGYPMISKERDLVASYFDQNSRDGFEVAYLVPGMNRVVQAAGRLIRNESDLGTVQLIDRRYADPVYRGLLPPWWRIEH
jgi:DNA excision repair protein ERCC-2